MVIEGTETPTSNELVTSSKFYKFYFKHPLAPLCEKDTECGFMLKITPGSLEEAGTFNIELVTEEYPADIHYHGISAAHMHLAVEEYFNNRWNNKCISCRGKPEYSGRGIAAKLPCFWEGALPCPSFALLFGRCPPMPSFCPPLALICPSFWASLKYTNHTISRIATFLKYT